MKSTMGHYEILGTRDTQYWYLTCIIDILLYVHVGYSLTQNTKSRHSGPERVGKSVAMLKGEQKVLPL